MATIDPYPQPASANPLPQAQPLAQGPVYTPAQPIAAQPYQPVAPTGYPQAQGYPQGQPVAGPQYPQAAYPQATAGYAYPQAQPVPAGGYARPVAQPQGAVGRPQPVSKATPQKQVLRGGKEEGEEEDLYEKATRSTPPYLISMAVHMLAMIIMGLIVAGTAAMMNRVDLTAMPPEEEPDEELIYAEKLGNQVEIDSPLEEDTYNIDKPVLAVSNLPPVENPFATPYSEMEAGPDGTVSVSDIAANAIGLALDGREAGSKKVLIGRYGGNATTEEAVIRGLEWLARQQRRDGSWSLEGPYRNGVTQGFDNPSAATAMALLAFQGHGETHKDGKFKKNVIDGWKWMLKEQDADGNFFHVGSSNHRYYTQAQCTIAACELLGMTKDDKYRDPAERAVKNLLAGQSPEGGWRYSPNADSDLSVTGWVVMALQSAKMAKLEVPDEAFRKIEKFLDRIAQADGARYPYQFGGEIRRSMTAEAILCRQYLGWKRSDPRMVDAMNWLTQENNLVRYTSDRDIYYWYYATQAAHHMEGEWWKRWNGQMRQILPENQIKRGAESGSWDPAQDQFTPHGGRLYATCLSIYMLEVYYRHLPIYTKIYTDLLKSGRTPGT